MEGLLLVRGDEYFMIRQMHRDGISIAEIARRTGRDRKTVRKVIRGQCTPAYGPRGKPVSKLDPFKPHIEKRIEAGVLNAVKILREIRAQGYGGGITIIKDFIRPRRQRAKAVRRFETPPGYQAQVDWATCGKIIHQGVLRTVYAFVMTLSYSRMLYVEFMLRCDTRAFIRGHINAFDFFGGIAKTNLYDNTKCVRLATDETGVHLNPAFADFADTFGFAPRLCRPHRPQTKGKVESGVKYVKGNFLVGEVFENLDELNQRGRIWLKEVANIRVHGTTGEVPAERFKDELLSPIRPHMIFDTALYERRKITRDCLVSYQGSRYGVPHRFAGRECLIKDYEDGRFEVLVDSAVAIAHELSAQKGRTIITSRPYAGLKKDVSVHKRRLVLLCPLPIVESRPLSIYESLAHDCS
jgi:transposase